MAKSQKPAKSGKRDAKSRKEDTEGRVTFRIDPEIKKKLETYAAADDRSLSSYIHRVLVDHVRTRGA